MTSTTSTTSTTVSASTVEIIEYGEASAQFGALWLPTGVSGTAPVVVLLHGGFWRTGFDLRLMDPLAVDLVGRGYAVWNLEYRRVGDSGGGWPGTFDDVAAGIDALVELADRHPLDLGRVALVGHSAGGHLALWAGGRSLLPVDAPGAAPRLEPAVVIGQGPVIDLTGAAEARLGVGAVADLLGGEPDDVPDRYELATPVFPQAARTVSIVGSTDDIVPPGFSLVPDMPDAIETVVVDAADHFDLIDPTHPAWDAVVQVLDASIGAPAS